MKDQINTIQKTIEVLLTKLDRAITADAWCVAEESQTWDAVQEAKKALSALSELKAMVEKPVAWMNPRGGILSASYIENFASGLDRETHNIPLYLAAPVAQHADQHASWCASLNTMLTTNPPKPAPCNCNSHKPAPQQAEAVPTTPAGKLFTEAKKAVGVTFRVNPDLDAETVRQAHVAVSEAPPYELPDWQKAALCVCREVVAAWGQRGITRSTRNRGQGGRMTDRLSIAAQGAKP